MKKILRTKPYIPENDKPYIMKCWEEILNNGMFIQGKYVSQLEKEFSSYCGTKYAIATNSGATALEVALRATGIENKRVIVPTQTFVASVSAIIRSNNIPVIVDIDENTQCLNADIIEKTLYEYDDVFAVMYVQMAGMISPNYHTMKSLCDRNGILFFEDASHAVGSSIDGIKAGNLGYAGCFSLFATKIITSGEGGIITTNDHDFAERCRVIRNHGCVRNDGKVSGLDYGVNCTYASSNYRMPEVSAVIGVSQVKRIDEFVDKRNALANRYNDKITNPKVIKPQIPNNIKMSWWQYIIVLAPELNREVVCSNLLNLYDIPTANAYWPACHKQPAFKQYIGEIKYPISDNLLKRHISLPMYVEMDFEQVDYISNVINKML